MSEIKFTFDSDSWRKRPVSDQIIYLKKLCSSQNEALDIIQRERNDLAKDKITLEAQLQNSGSAVDINKTIMINSITEFNAEKQEYIKRIQQLQAILREHNISFD